MRLSRTVSEINGDFSRKSPTFPSPLYLALPLKEFPLKFGRDARVKKTRMMGLPEGPTRFKTGLAV